MIQDFPLKTMKSQGVRALNKPITLLWLIGQYYLFEKTEFHFIEAEGKLKDFIRDYTGNPIVVDPSGGCRITGFWSFRNLIKSKSVIAAGLLLLIYAYMAGLSFLMNSLVIFRIRTVWFHTVNLSFLDISRRVLKRMFFSEQD